MIGVKLILRVDWCRKRKRRRTKITTAEIEVRFCSSFSLRFSHFWNEKSKCWIDSQCIQNNDVTIPFGIGTLTVLNATIGLHLLKWMKFYQNCFWNDYFWWFYLNWAQNLLLKCSMVSMFWYGIITSTSLWHFTQSFDKRQKCGYVTLSMIWALVHFTLTLMPVHTEDDIWSKLTMRGINFMNESMDTISTSPFLLHRDLMNVFLMFGLVDSQRKTRYKIRWYDKRNFDRGYKQNLCLWNLNEPFNYSVWQMLYWSVFNCRYLKSDTKS